MRENDNISIVKPDMKIIKNSYPPPFFILGKAEILFCFIAKILKKSQFYFPPENLATMEMLVMIKEKNADFHLWHLNCS